MSIVVRIDMSVSRMQPIRQYCSNQVGKVQTIDDLRVKATSNELQYVEEGHETS